MTIKKDYDQVYFTSYELCLGATLIALGIPLDSIDKSSPKRVAFIFKRSPEMDHAVQAFWSKELRLEPNAFWESIRFLKSRIYGG